MDIIKEVKMDCLNCPYEYTCDWDKGSCWFLIKYASTNPSSCDEKVNDAKEPKMSQRNRE